MWPLTTNLLPWRGASWAPRRVVVRGTGPQHVVLARYDLGNAGAGGRDRRDQRRRPAPRDTSDVLGCATPCRVRGRWRLDRDRHNRQLMVRVGRGVDPPEAFRLLQAFDNIGYAVFLVALGAYVVLWLRGHESP